MPSGGGAGTVYYLFGDQLGTVIAVTSLSGTLISSQKYWPYGAQRSGGITQTDKLFTGQQQEPNDSALGLYNYNARFYSTTLGRFASVDPVGGGGDPQSWNGYAYVRNDPLAYVDPTGMWPWDAVASTVGGWIGSGGDLVGDALDAYNWANGSLENAARNVDSADIHMALDVVGMAPVPVVAHVADVANAALHAYEGDYANALMSLGSAIPVGGNGFAAVKMGLKYEDEGFAASKFAAKHQDDARRALARARELGDAGEAAAGIVKNTRRVESALGSGQRVPDEYLPELGRMGEVKFRSAGGKVYDTAQLRDYRAMASRDDLEFTLYVNDGTEVSRSIQRAIDNGDMRLEHYKMP